jgi:hypothetical protein
MSDVITEYQKWKQHGEDLRVQAKQAMESRYRELLSEAMHIAEEYRADFGVPLKPTSPIKAFRYKASPRAKAKKPAAKRLTDKNPRGVAPAASVAVKPNRKVVGLEKQLAIAKKRLDDAKSAAKPTQALEDRIYEIEDELRLAGQTK